MSMTDEAKKISRRDFLKIVGATSALGVSACGDKATQKIIPYVHPVTEQIPGSAVWYNSTCNECSAGCGIQVRTREGRAVKIEGNPAHPVNRGGLCALGQSALQSMYDPDRIRQPLLKDSMGNFQPISWDQAYAMVIAVLKDSANSKAFISGGAEGSLGTLIGDWAKSFGVQHVSYDSSAPQAELEACRMVYGEGGLPQFAINKSDVVLNFGADFLETWVSPVGFARDWATARKAEKPLRLIHVEPRLSLSGANADMWLKAEPGKEVLIAKIIVKELLARGRGSNLDSSLQDKLKKVCGGVDSEALAVEAGVNIKDVLLVATYLSEARAPLVLAGGVATQTNNPLPLLVLANLINVMLGVVGSGPNDTVNLGARRRYQSSTKELINLLAKIKSNRFKTVFVYGANPTYSLPPSVEAEYAFKHTDLMVSFSSHMDETTQQAHLILPTNVSLESWGDSNPLPGVHSLTQPTMQPVFDTRALGDILIDLASKSGKSDSAQGAQNFQDYLKESWKKVHENNNAGKDFKQFWLESVESGGVFGGYQSALANSSSARPSKDILDLEFDAPEFEGPHGAPIIYPFTSVKTFDGRAANRPWLQELPDPISQVVWDAWAELHPKMAERIGVTNEDVITIRNARGELNLPVLITPHLSESIIAIPLGHGHKAFGRYAKNEGSNVLELLSSELARGVDGLSLLSTHASVTRARGRSDLAKSRGSDTQMGRNIARVSYVGAAAESAKSEEGHAKEGHGGHGGHEFKQMYEQREHPLYHWGMAVDLATCTGCSACVVACYAENNIAVVGKKVFKEGRTLSWLRIERYYDQTAEELHVSFLPMMCQHCGNAPCEPVCPVYATYHNEEGMNVMVYNRCVGTRYCSNNCSYKVRRFNWFEYETPEPLTWQFNPDVTPRSVGIMEKCTFCVQRILEAKDKAKDLGRGVLDGEVKPACVQSCPTQALVFGNLNDPHSEVSRMGHESRAYKVLDEHLNTQPAVTYLEDIKYSVSKA